MPERTCISCRLKGNKGELLRICLLPVTGTEVFDEYLDIYQRLPGRGWYVHLDSKCVRGKGFQQKLLNSQLQYLVDKRAEVSASDKEFSKKLLIKKGGDLSEVRHRIEVQFRNGIGSFLHETCKQFDHPRILEFLAGEKAYSESISTKSKGTAHLRKIKFL